MQKSSLSFFVCLLVLSPSLLLSAQSTTTLGDKRIPDEKEFSHPSSHKHSPRLKKIKVKHTPRYEFYKRVEKVAKEKQRTLKKLAEPQYANVSYFGHKRPPKKNPANRMRYCKECGIRH